MITRPQHDTHWRSVKLGEVIHIKHGYAFQGQFFADSGPHVLLTPGNFEEGGGFRVRGAKEKYYVGPVDRDYVLSKGDLVVVMTEQAEGLLGSSALIAESGRFLHNQRLGLVTPLRPGEVDTRFLYHLFNYREVRAQIRASASGVKVRHTSPSRISEVRVNFPPLEVQRRIADILCCYEDLIDNNRRRISILEDMARAIYREWFVEFRALGVRLRKATPAEKKATGKDVFPEGWHVGKLAGFVETQYGYTESANEVPVGPKFVRGMDINKTSYIEWDTVPYCPIDTEDQQKHKLRPGDVLVVRMADPGKVGIIERDIEAVFASYLIRVRLVSKALSPYYLFYFLLSDRYQDYIGGASTGTTRKSASAGVLVGLDVVVPLESVVARFEEEIGAVRGLLSKLVEASGNLKRTRDFLLPRLMSGEISGAALDGATAGRQGQEIADISA